MYAIAQKDKMGKHCHGDTNHSVLCVPPPCQKLSIVIVCLSGLDKAVEDMKYAMKRYGVTV